MAFLLLCGSADLLAGGGSGGTGISTGTISGFGSIFVNGIEYDISSAKLIRDGRDVSESDFSLGEIVTIKGAINHERNTGVATSVIYENMLSGPVTALSDSNRIEVLGQTVVTNHSTVLDQFSTLNELQIGQYVEISGFHDAENHLVATRIMLLADSFKPGSSKIAARLFVESVNTESVPVSLNAGKLTVRFPHTERIPVAGELIHVSASTNPVGMQLNADELRVIDQPRFEEGTRLNIEGIITRFNSGSSFTVNGIDILTHDKTRIETVMGKVLAINGQIEAEGIINDKGILVADRLEIADDHTSSEFNGNIQKIDRKNQRIRIFDVTFPVSEATEIRDSTSGTLKLHELAEGDWVELYFTVSGDDLTVEIVERNKPGIDEVEGTVSKVNREHASLVVLGKTIITSTDTLFKGPNGNTISADSFFRSISINTTEIDAKGTYNSTSKLFMAHTLQVED